MCEYINGAIIQEDFNMEEYIFDKSNGLWYELQGDYYIPCLTVPVQDEKPIGIWGQGNRDCKSRVNLRIR